MTELDMKNVGSWGAGSWNTFTFCCPFLLRFCDIPHGSPSYQRTLASIIGLICPTIWNKSMHCIVNCSLHFRFETLKLLLGMMGLAKVKSLQESTIWAIRSMDNYSDIEELDCTARLTKDEAANQLAMGERLLFICWWIIIYTVYGLPDTGSRTRQCRRGILSQNGSLLPWWSIALMRSR